MDKVFITIILLIKYVNSRMDNFIVGGEYTSTGKYSHQVYLKIHAGHSFVCGGSIINQDIVLTAAHCLEDIIAGRNHYIILKYGSCHLNDGDIKLEKAKSFKIYDWYISDLLVYDIGLVRTRYQLPLNELVQRVAIMKNPPYEKYAFVSGWGATILGEENKQKTSENLKFVKQEIKSYKECSHILDIPEGVFCAGPVDNSGYPYSGDSGGALVIQNYIQIGIVSYKAAGYLLTAYTNVSYFYSWILDKSGDLHCDII